MTFLLFSLTVFFSPATSETKPDPVVSSLIRVPPSLCSVKKTTISSFSTSPSASSSFCLNPKIQYRFQPMEFPLVFQAPSVPHPPTTASFCTPGGRGAPFDVLFKKDKRKSSSGSVWGGGGVRFAPLPVRASEGEGSSGGRESSGESASSRGGFTGSTMEVRTFNQGFGDSDFPAWERIGAVVRMSYGIGIYAAMALAGKFICSIVGIDYMEGFQPSFDAVLSGLGYATPPIMALLFILDDEVVRLSPHARAIRDVEDEELRGFFYGMSLWQFILTVAASSVGEELFYRAAVQGALSDIFLRGTNFVTDARGMVSLTGVLPPFVPFAQAFAAVVTAALTGSLYYVASFPTDPTYVVAPVLQSRAGRDDLKKLFAAWYERRQMKKIYSPLLEGLLALYLGFEWIQTDNILAPIITHGIYSTVILGHGLWKIHDHRRRLRQRVRKLKSEEKGS